MGWKQRLMYVVGSAGLGAWRGWLKKTAQRKIFHASRFAQVRKILIQFFGWLWHMALHTPMHAYTMVRNDFTSAGLRPFNGLQCSSVINWSAIRNAISLSPDVIVIAFYRNRWRWDNHYHIFRNPFVIIIRRCIHFIIHFCFRPFIRSDCCPKQE